VEVKSTMLAKDIRKSGPYLTQEGLRTTKLGYQYDLSSDVWEVDAEYFISFQSEAWNIFKNKTSFKRCLAGYLETHSVSYAVNIHSFFSRYLEDQKVESISIKTLASWRKVLGQKREYQLGAIRGFIYQWEQLGLPGVGSNVASWLEEQIITGNEKGRAVRQWCPYSGPYSKTELGSILEWTTDAFRDGFIDYEVHALIYLLATTGQRGIQLQKLRAKDLIASSTKKENQKEENFVLNIPMAKERLAASFRGEFIAKPVTRAIYLVAANLRDQTRRRISGMLGKELSDEEASELPLFPSWIRIKRFLRKEGKSKKKFLREHADRPNTFHVTRYELRKLLTYEFNRTCPLVCEVTGEPLMLSARRFRYTYGTNCARQGLVGRYLARALGHRDDQNIHCYVETSPEIADRINQLMSGPLVTVSQALAGQLVSSERDAVRGDDPRSRIKNDVMQNVGTCGSYEFCPSGWRSCYTCSRFQPWLDAPHAHALENLLEERQTMVSAGCSDLVIQTSDRLINAIKKVIELCDAENENRSTIDMPNK
jgi:integrase